MTPHLEIIDGAPRLVTASGKPSAFLDADQVALLLCTAARGYAFNRRAPSPIEHQESVGGVTVNFAADRATLDFIADAAQWLKRQIGDDPRPHRSLREQI